MQYNDHGILQIKHIDSKINVTVECVKWKYLVMDYTMFRDPVYLWDVCLNTYHKRDSA